MNIHDDECTCLPCMNAELDEIAAVNGIQWASFELPSGTPTAVRTRYAKPGQACGNGVVRKVSAKQIAFIKRLMTERDTSKLVRFPGSEDIENMSLTGARDLIDRLLGCPELPKVMIQVRMASEKQIAYVESLAERKGVDIDTTDMTMEQASEYIDQLRKLADKPVPVEVAHRTELTVGIYRHDDGRIVQVKPNRQGTRMYGKLYDAIAKCWIYEAGLLRGLTMAHRMTIEQCQELSVEMGSCCLCGRDLTATVDGVPPAQRYIGPICAGKLG